MNQYKANKNKTYIHKEDNILINTLLPTTKCQLIACTYTLEVSFVHAGATLGSKIPPAKLPITIEPIQEHITGDAIAVPQGWNP